MISKRILISMIVIISLVQFITCTTPSVTKPKDPAATTGAKPRETPKPKPVAGKSSTTATGPTEAGMNPDEDIAKVPEKPTGLRHKLFKPIKSIFWPLRFIWGKIKNFKNRGQNKNKKETAKPGSGENVDGNDINI